MKKSCYDDLKCTPRKINSLYKCALFINLMYITKVIKTLFPG